MFEFIPTLYLVVLVIYILTCIFVCYHIIKYYVSPINKIITLITFSVISAILLFLNLGIFFSINWKIILESLY